MKKNRALKNEPKEGKSVRSGWGQFQRLDAARIRPAEYNPRKMTAHDRLHLRKSIEEFGVVQVLVVNRRVGSRGWSEEEAGYTLVGGHQTFREAQALGIVEFDCQVVELDRRAEKRLNLALNRISGDWNPALLPAVLREAMGAGGDALGLGFAEKEAQDILAKLESEEVIPDVPFAEELDEASHYVVLRFRSHTDWLQALTLFNLETVKVLRGDGRSVHMRGLGRVVDGPGAIRALQNAK